VRTADVTVNDVSPQHDCSRLEVMVVSPRFDGLPVFKRRDMVNGYLADLRKEPGFGANIAKLNMFSPQEQEGAGIDEDEKK